MYLGYIAEQAGGFAVIGRDGKLYIKTIGEDTVELNLRYFSEYSWGERFKVSRIAYEDGVQNFKKGDETNNTIWISSDNMYIVDQEQIDNIYNKYKDFEVYSFSGTSIVDPAWDIGDILIIDNKKVVYQGELEYKGKFKASISSDIQAKTKEETTATKVSEATKIRRVQSQIDQINAKIQLLVQDSEEFEDNITQINLEIGSINQKVENITTYTRTQKTINQIHLTDCASSLGYIKDLIIYGNTALFTTNEITIVVSSKSRGYGENISLMTESGESLLTEDGKEIIVGERSFYIDRKTLVLDDILRSLTIDDITYYDTLEISQDGVITVTRKIGVNENGELYLLDEEIITVLDEGFILPSEEEVYYYIEELEGLEYYIEYIIKNEYNDLFANKVELTTLVSETAEEFRVEVNKKVDEDEFGTHMIINYESLRVAWNQISQYIQFEPLNDIASINIYGENNKLLTSLNQNGQTFYSETGEEIGLIGLVKDDNTNFLAFSLPTSKTSDNTYETADKMAWGITDQNGKFYEIFSLESAGYTDEGEFSGALSVVGSLDAYAANVYLLLQIESDASIILNSIDDTTFEIGVNRYYENGSSTNYEDRLRLDGPLSLGEIKQIDNTASGTLFSNNPSGGIIIENGLIKEWNLNFWSGTVTYGNMTLSFEDGMLIDVIGG